MSKAYQGNAFQSSYPGELFAFQGADRYVDIPASSSLSVDGALSLTLFRTGSFLTFSVGVRDPSTVPPLAYNVDTVQITIYYPDSTVLVNAASMVNISIGEYSYALQTASNYPVGPYSGYVKATNGTYIFSTLNTVLFILQSA